MIKETKTEYTYFSKDHRFNKARHLHQILIDEDWKNLTGCTTVLGVLAKPAFIQWAADMAVNYVREQFQTSDRVIRPLKVTGKEDKDAKVEHWFELHESILESILEGAKSAHRKKKEKAGDWGTEVHAWIETYIKAYIKGNHETVSVPLEGLKGEACKHFMKWTFDNKVRFLESEKHMYSKKYFIGGICDILCEIGDQLWMVDIKTGSGIYPEAFAQMAGYELMMQEMGYPPITGSIVLNLKKDGTFQEKRSISNEDSRKLFLACLDIYRSQEKLKSL